jgi:hypothetical protein
MTLFFQCTGYNFDFIFTSALDATLILFLPVRWMQAGCTQAT